MATCRLWKESQEDEARDWDDSTRRAEEGELQGDPENARALCTCGRPLQRYAKVPVYQTFLLCSREHECSECEETISPGEMHFICTACSGVRICKDCGPGVCIQREYDYLDALSGETQVKQLPSRVIHVRKRDAVLESPATDVASKVFQQTSALVKQVAEEEDMLHRDWQEEGLVFQLLGASDEKEASKSLMSLVEGCQQVLASQPLLSQAKLPCKIFGDTHGQLRDVLMFFHAFGMPGAPDCPNVVFNGDFVDRGQHQLELLIVLLALKVLYPTKVQLNRGNHEDTTMNNKYGFANAVRSSFAEPMGSQMFDMISQCFMYLPVACLVGGKVLVLHGGIGDGKWRLGDLTQVKRPISHEDLQNPSNRILWNILWSDPIEDDDQSSKVFGVHQSPRSKMAVKFGWNVTQAFCAQNGLDLIVRSHQSKKGGLGFDVMHNELLLRVFSARDYEGHANDGAVLQVQEEDGVISVRSQVLRSIAHESEDEDSTEN